MRRTSGACEEPGGDGRGPFSPGEVEVLAEQLCGLTLPGGRTSSRDDREGSDSLMQHIQVEARPSGRSCDCSPPYKCVYVCVRVPGLRLTPGAAHPAAIRGV